MLTLTPEKKDFLARVVGADNAAGIVTTAERATKALEAAGIKFKENGDPELVTPAQAAAGDTQAQGTGGTQTGTQATGEADAGIEALKELLAPLMSQTQSIEGLALAVKAITDRLDALEKSDDDRLAAINAPRRINPASVVRPSEKGGNDISSIPDAVAAIEARNGVGVKEGEEVNDSPVAPYIDLLRQELNIPRAPAGAAAS